ncbi:MAG: LytR C-terminal domain-containing protein [Actinomycetes bacterium]
MATGDRPAYPPDEFDRIPRPASRIGGRRGAHRGRPSPLASLIPALLVLVAVLAVVLGIGTLLSTRPPKSAATPGGASTHVSSPTQTSSPEGTTESPSASDSSDTATDTATDTASGTGMATPSGEVDHGASIRVVNATSTSGLAAQAGQTLIRAGWNVSGLGNQSQTAEATTVYYGVSSLRPTATAVARDLGVTSVRLDPQVTQSITVVIGADFAH